MTALDPARKFDGATHSKQSLRLWLRLLSCSTLLEKRIRRRLAEDFETTLPRFDVLAAFERAPAGLSMGELSKFLLVSNGNVTGIVSRLIEDGLAERVAGGDRRTVRVRMTPRGRRTFKTISAQHEKWIDKMMGGLSGREIATLLALLAKVRTSIAGSPT